MKTLNFKPYKALQLTILVLLVVIYTPQIRAFSTNTFNNSLTAENLTFTGNENITRYLAVPSGNILTSGFLNITGYQLVSGGLISYHSFDNSSGILKDDINSSFDFTDNSAGHIITYPGKVKQGIFSDSVTSGQHLIWGKNPLNYAPLNDGVTISFWHNQSGTCNSVNNMADVFGTGASGTPNGDMGLQYYCATSKYRLIMGPGIWTLLLSSTNNFNKYAWNNIVMEINATYVKIYINGNLEMNSSWSSGGFNFNANAFLFDGENDDGDSKPSTNAVVDEIGVWNRLLNTGEISSLYALAGSKPSGTSTNTSLTVGDIPLSLSLSSNGTIPKTIRTSNLASTINSYLGSCAYTGGFCFVPFIFHSDTIGTLGYSDLIFNNLGFVENSQSYNPITSSGSYETFKINFTAQSIDSIQFVYNNTIYSASLINTGNNYIGTSSLNVPSVSVVTNKTFYWALNIAGTNYNSSFNNQTINVVSIDNCTTNTLRILNLTLYDEETGLIIPDGITGNGTIEVWINLYPINQYPNSNYLVATYHTKFNPTNTGSVCLPANILNNVSYYEDVQISYGAEGYVNKLYNIQKYLLTNATALQDIKLWNLITGLATKFLITVKDANYNLLADALILVERKYIGEGVYKIVEAPLTDNYGSATASFNLNGVLYTLVVMKDGVVLATFNDLTMVCTDPAITQCALNLNVQSGSEGFPNATIINGLVYNLNFNQNTRLLSLDFYTSNGMTSLINLTAIDFGNGNIICSNTLSSSSGTLTCAIPTSFQNGTFVAEIYEDGIYVAQGIFTISLPSSNRFGSEGMILLLVLILTIPLMFITDTIGILAGALIGFVIGSILLLYSGGSIIGTSATLTWLIIAIGIIIYKISQRRREFG